MRRTKNDQFSVPLLATIAFSLSPAVAYAATAGDVGANTILNTSALWADSQSYHACLVANISTGNVNVQIELISGSGAVLETTGTTAITVSAGTVYELSESAGAGFARCRFTLGEPQSIRANLTVFHPLSGGFYQTYATSEAR